MRVNAQAKINLAIDVLGRREDGYHELEMVMQTLALADAIEIEATDAPDIRLVCEPPVTGAETDNLAYRAARLLQRETGCVHGAHIRLEKRIPVQAGLGGGSSDAAAVLRALDALWELRLPSARLMELAARLGSDVPFFLVGGTAFVSGRGERVEPVAPLAPRDVLLVKPKSGLSTPAVYGALGPMSGRCVRHAARAFVRALERCEALPAPRMQALLHNDLQPAACRLCPAVRDILDVARAAGAAALVSGSGPTVMVFGTGGRRSAQLAKHLTEAGHLVVATRTAPGENFGPTAGFAPGLSKWRTSDSSS